MQHVCIESILTVFNWTEKERKHEFSLSDLGAGAGHNQVLDVFAPGSHIAENLNSLSLSLAPQSVRMVKIFDTSIPAAAPLVKADIPGKTEAGKPVPSGLFRLRARTRLSLGLRGWNQRRRGLRHTHVHARRQLPGAPDGGRDRGRAL
jgi:hypothetical protein